jgi:hypothetical protein
MRVWVSGGELKVYAGGAYPDWCDRCMSSAAVRIRFYLFTTDGPRFAGLWWACQVCDPQRFEGDGPGGDAAEPACV